MWIYFIILGYVLGCLYATWQLMWWLKHTTWGHRHKLHTYAIMLGIVDVIPFLGAFLPEGAVGAHFQRIGNVWLGWVAIMGVCLVLGHVLKAVVHTVSTRQAEVILAIMLAITAAFNIGGFVHAQHIYTHYYQLKISDEGAELVSESIEPDPCAIDCAEDSTRIALLADLHMGVNTRYATIEKLVNLVNDHDVDAVIGGGDYFTSSYMGLSDAKQYAELLAKMTADGTPAYMAYGNHDVTEPLFCGFALKDRDEVLRYQDMDRFFALCNWQMLADQLVEIDGIQFYFRQDRSKTGDGRNHRASAVEIAEVVSGADTADKAKPLIIVQHEPGGYAELAGIGADLVLSGHTHDGQIWPGTWLVRAFADNAHGYKVLDGVSSVVSSGVGYFGPPLRVGSHGEVVIIDIVQE